MINKFILANFEWKFFLPMIPVSWIFRVTKLDFQGALQKKISIKAFKKLLFSKRTFSSLQPKIYRTALTCFVQKIWASENRKIPTLRPQISKTIRIQNLSSNYVYLLTEIYNFVIDRKVWMCTGSALEAIVSKFWVYFAMPCGAGATLSLEDHITMCPPSCPNFPIKKIFNISFGFP